MNLSQRFQFFQQIKKPHETYDTMGHFTAYYLKIYDQHKEKAWFPSWNWSFFFAAFFRIEVLWFLYRRMYFLAFLVSMLGHALYTLLSYKLVSISVSFGGAILGKVVSWVCRLLFVFGLTIFSNALYFQFVRQNIKNNAKKTGVNPIAPLLYVLLQIWLSFTILPKIIDNNPHAKAVYKTLLDMQ
jgi:hypothetical protein